MAWNFTADSEIQTELSTKLNEYADNYDGKVTELYGKISEMGSHWIGEDYDLFKTGCEGYKTALQDLSNSIRMYSVHFGKVSTGTEELATALIQIIKNMTEVAGASPVGGDGTQTGGNGTQTGGNGTQTGGDGTQTGGDGTQTGGDGTQTGGDGTQTGGDGTQTGGDGTQTGGDGTQTGGDGTQTGGDGTQTGGDGTQTGGDGTQTGGDGTQTGGNGTQAKKGTDDYFIQRGDSCSVHNQDVKFYGRDGSYNYYEGADGQLYVDNGSSLEPIGCTSSSFNIGYLKDGSAWYGAVSTSNDGASNMKLPDSETVTSTGTAYDDYGMGEYVDYSSMAHTSEPTTYSTNDAFKTGVKNDRPAVIEIDGGLKCNNHLLYGSDLKPTSNGKVTLVYDERAGKYYQLDENGNYDRDMYGYTPDELISHYSVR